MSTRLAGALYFKNFIGRNWAVGNSHELLWKYNTDSALIAGRRGKPQVTARRCCRDQERDYRIDDFCACQSSGAVG
jgi:hypothetical protein